MAEYPSRTSPQSLPDGIVPEEVVVRTEKTWFMVMAGMLVVMIACVVGTGITSALHPSSNGEQVDPTTLHQKGEFVESNLGTSIEPDGSATVRIIAEQFNFVPTCVLVPQNTPVKFRLTSADVIHGFLIPDTNVNTMVIPGYVSEVRTQFSKPGKHLMPCHEYCGVGHQAMWANVIVVPQGQLAELKPDERTSCDFQ